MRESHARDFIANTVHPNILDEEFPEFQTLLNALEDEVPTITLSWLSPLAALLPATHTASSGQKRRAEGDLTDLADTGASSPSCKKWDFPLASPRPGYPFPTGKP